jgi:hypothetical protein
LKDKIKSAANELKCDDTTLTKITTIVDFLVKFNELSTAKREIEFLTNQNDTKSLKKFIKNHFDKRNLPFILKIPETSTDEALRQILIAAIDRPEKVDEYILAHKMAMNAENLVGRLLETYIASAVEPQSNVAWCCANEVKATDFLIPNDGKHPYKLLQVKNRDNTENSSSNKIRDGLPIECIRWYRTNAKSSKTEWATLNQIFGFTNDLLTEKNFQKFVRTNVKFLDRAKIAGLLREK